MDEVVIYKSRRKAVHIIVGSFLIALAGYLLWHYTGRDVIGWSFLLFSAFLLILGVGTLFDRKPKIILTARGITETTVLREEIEWDAIRQVDEFFYRGQYFVRLLVDRDYKPGLLSPTWFYRLDRMYAQEGVKALFIRVGILEVNSIRLSQLIRQMIEADDRVVALKKLSSYINV